MRCAPCDGELPPNARFCPACGSAVPVESAVAPVEERKVVTVVFCDLVGSTALSGVLDPETLRTVVLRYFDLMRECLEEFGGTVEKFIGDAVMAVFGVPVTHEDDAARASAAALAMLDAVERLNERELHPSLGIRLGVRIGVNTGPAVTSTDVSTRQALVSGETVNIAARLEQASATGEVLIGPETRRAAGAAVRTESVGPLGLKGKEEPVTAHRLLGVVEADPAAGRRFDVPFVGRTAELAWLREAFMSTVVPVRRGANLLTLYGEAGMGKTRLIHEWHKADGDSFAQGSGRCRPYGEHGSLAPLADALRQLLSSVCGELTADHDPGPAEAGATADRTEAARSLDVLAAGLLEDGTPNPSLDDTCAAVVGLLTVVARRRPVVLVVDDCQWASELLLDVLETLAGELTSQAVLFVCMARPDLHDRRPGWGQGRLRPSALTLPGLTPAEAEALAGALTGAGTGTGGTGIGADGGADGLGSAVSVHVLEAAGGNPFYLEQLLTALGQPESGYRLDGAGALPTSLQALLGARIGGLGRAERAVLDLASVVGREFGADDVAALAAEDREGAPGGALHTPAGQGSGGSRGPIDSALARLRRHRLVRVTERQAPGTPGLRFSSGLVHEVTYQSMAKRARAERHERAARLAEARLSEAPPVRGAGPAEADAMVAGHLEHAYRYRAELGLLDARTHELRLGAARLLIRGGSQALARSDLSWAGVLLGRAVELTSPTDDEWVAAARRLGGVRLATGQVDEGRSLLLAVLAATPPVPGGPTPSPVRSASGGGTGGGPTAADAGSRVEAAHALLELAAASAAPDGSSAGSAASRTLPVFERAGDDLGQARACIRIAQDRQLHGRHGAADVLLTRALEHATRSGAEPERALALGAIGISLWRGPEPVPDAVSRARLLLREHGERRPTARLTLSCPLAVLLALQEHWEEADTALADARRLAGELGYAEGAVVLPLFSAAVAALAGDTGRALALLEEAADSGRRLKAEGLLGAVARDTARLLVDEGRFEEAALRLPPPDRPVSGSAPTTPAPSEAADLDGLLARIAAARGEPGEATALADRAVLTAARTDSTVVRAVALLDQAEVLRSSGRRAGAGEAALRAQRCFTAKGHLPGARRAAEMHAALEAGSPPLQHAKPG
ncbi:adenylate/guanylate cyclase domain-containing protein [Streptomyces sp. NBC_01497]|uniref:adenylate/guanylate cyclase domain-containing protein n=1 Tax=Streptomyces sp. NBC_01497 TaxID=2903885 RepID=UPI002E371CAC|nr:adenylate/guanylate cyclase domain-containing protein [Streptomyces sp. NBC_01497]